jgi:hypothetical protein
MISADYTDWENQRQFAAVNQVVFMNLRNLSNLRLQSGLTSFSFQQAQ